MTIRAGLPAHIIADADSLQILPFYPGTLSVTPIRRVYCTVGHSFGSS
ncbi:MAG: hypothetical protein U9Q77_11055 [Candidatus Marinimicrobia bacterium]|nr:hypothetical protein [Candidatus Neomarinimicrobiota bacterium]